MNKTIFIASSTFAQDDEKPLAMLRDQGFTVVKNSTGRRLNGKDLVELSQGSIASIAGLETYDKDVLTQWPSLRCISRCGVGVDTIDLGEARKRSIAVFNTPDAVVTPVSEMAIAMILDLMRGVSLHAAGMRARRWERVLGENLAGKTVGVIGLGRIGRRVAELLTRLDARVIAYDIAPDAAWAKEHQVWLVGLGELIRMSSVITIHVSLLQEHPFVLSKEQIFQMPQGAMIVNLARGNCIDEEGLIEALKEGHIAAAALDVFAQEPYEGPLCDFPNVILTPHIATFTRQARLQMEVQSVENVIQFLNHL